MYREQTGVRCLFQDHILCIDISQIVECFGAAFCNFDSAPKVYTHPWLRVVHVGISVIFNGRCHT